jgi:hypothetical protein
MRATVAEALGEAGTGLRHVVRAAQPRHSPSTSLNASRAFRKASIPEGMPQ